MLARVFLENWWARKGYSDWRKVWGGDSGLRIGGCRGGEALVGSTDKFGLISRGTCRVNLYRGI